MDLALTQTDQMLPPPRRHYKRFTPQQWEEQKDRIRELWIVQDKKAGEVVRILKECHGFEVGERQLKRHTDAWGFAKNIPKDEMQKMLLKRKKREDESARPTKFLRRHGDGDFQVVAQDRLDVFQRRFGHDNVSSTSLSSGMPSNIIYHTPSSGNRDRYSNNSPPHNFDQITCEFNDSVEQIFDTTQDQVRSSTARLRGRNAIVTRRHHDSARQLAFDGHYQQAAQMYKLSSLSFDRKHRWGVVADEFLAALMKAADFPGCPQSLIARFAQELSRFLIRERKLYTQTNAQSRSLVELHKTLTVLRMNAKWAAILITQQRALHIWEPILGPEHRKIELMRDCIARMRAINPVDLEAEPKIIQDAEDLPEALRPDNIPQLRSIGTLLHLCDGSPDDLLQKFHALESSNISNGQTRQDMVLLQYGRSRSLIGGYYSFLGRFDDAEKAFQESDRNMKYEICVEIKLHRILWYAEHKTRVRDDEGVRMLISQAHEVFMGNDKPTEFILAHFPDRFHYLCKAASKRVSIDEVLDEPLDESASERHQRGDRSASVLDNSAIRPQSPQASSDPLAERLFPLTPRGFGSAIDVESWRDFVHFSPTMDSLHRAAGSALTSNEQYLRAQHKNVNKPR